jgi:excisionase family DNA binding protein
MFLDLDRAASGQLVIAIQLLERWRRQQGHPAVAPDLVELRDALQTVMRRQEPSKVAGSSSDLDDAAVAPSPMLLTYDQAAEGLGVSKSTIERLVAGGELATVDVGGRRIAREDLDDLVVRRRRRRQTRPEAPVPPGVRFKGGVAS